MWCNIIENLIKDPTCLPRGAGWASGHPLFCVKSAGGGARSQGPLRPAIPDSRKHSAASRMTGSENLLSLEHYLFVQVSALQIKRSELDSPQNLFKCITVFVVDTFPCKASSQQSIPSEQQKNGNGHHLSSTHWGVN